MAITSARASALASLHRGLRQSPEDLVIGALIMAPFALALGIWISWVVPAPSSVLILFTLAATAVMGVWNAGFLAAAREGEG